ncbi:MAG: TIGR00268 family protein, partial [Chloroflexales bacterium]|nr:TIGR00268 family protein [Chloroflexales bacterium]
MVVQDELYNPLLDAKEAYLRAILAEMGGVVIGMSGGVDSVLLARVAQEVLGTRAIAVTANSPSLPRRELRQAGDLARLADIEHLVIDTGEVADPRYAANPTNRCYFCKSELFARLQAIADERGLGWVAYGENRDDLSDHRPGARAAAQRGGRAPRKKARLTQ